MIEVKNENSHITGNYDDIACELFIFLKAYINVLDEYPEVQENVRIILLESEKARETVLDFLNRVRIFK